MGGGLRRCELVGSSDDGDGGWHAAGGRASPAPLALNEVIAESQRRVSRSVVTRVPARIASRRNEERDCRVVLPTEMFVP